MTNICQNRRARYEYQIFDTLECGIVLVGTEVKSLALGRVSIDEAYATIDDGELWLIGSNIQEYSKEKRDNHAPKRRRKLLLKKQELRKFAEKNTQKGFTLIPLQMYFKNGKAKIEIALCKGKKTFDKRQSEREKQDRKTIHDL